MPLPHFGNLAPNRKAAKPSARPAHQPVLPPFQYSIIPFPVILRLFPSRNSFKRYSTSIRQTKMFSDAVHTDKKTIRATKQTVKAKTKHPIGRQCPTRSSSEKKVS
jgi:hypothetical protein